MDLKNKTVVVTGSSSGIGEAVAKEFAKHGAMLIVHSKSNKQGGEKVVKEIIANGGKAKHIQADLTMEEDVSSFFNQIKSICGSIDVLINNAGRTVPQDIYNTTKEHWQVSLDTNLLSTVICCKEAIKIMTSGAIINTSSIRGLEHTGREGIMAYSAAKAAINNFTKTLAKELSPNISVNAVAPGFVRTPYIDTVSDELINNWMELIPINRFIKTEEIAKVYTFLASSPFITGSIIVADGGFTLKIG
jgi:3-oxoacyl-[acyl-carrier protein] reductase